MAEVKWIRLTLSMFDDVLAAITTDADVDASFVSPQGVLFGGQNERATD